MKAPFLGVRTTYVLPTYKTEEALRVRLSAAGLPT